jgi:hypothetical protein
MMRRALAQLPDVNQITHLFAHGGSEALRRPFTSAFSDAAKRWRAVMVELVEADSLYQSAASDTPMTSSGRYGRSAQVSPARKCRRHSCQGILLSSQKGPIV